MFMEHVLYAKQYSSEQGNHGPCPEELGPLEEGEDKQIKFQGGSKILKEKKRKSDVIGNMGPGAGVGGQGGRT